MKPEVLERIVRGKKVLYLHLTKEAFSITGEPTKMFEIRRRSKWIISRLFLHSDESIPKDYDYVCISEGYSYRKWKLLSFNFIEIMNCDVLFSFGLKKYPAKTGDFIIHFKKLIAKN